MYLACAKYDQIMDTIVPWLRRPGSIDMRRRPLWTHAVLMIEIWVQIFLSLIAAYCGARSILSLKSPYNVWLCIGHYCDGLPQFSTVRTHHRDPPSASHHIIAQLWSYFEDKSCHPAMLLVKITLGSVPDQAWWNAQPRRMCHRSQPPPLGPENITRERVKE